MSQWALLKGNDIHMVFITTKSRVDMERNYPDYTVRDLSSMPTDVQERYQFWDERP